MTVHAARDAPLARPALYAGLLISAIRALEAFEVPALLGVPDGTYVFTSRAWKALDTFPAQIGDAAAYALPLLAITAVGVAVLLAHEPACGPARRGHRARRRPAAAVRAGPVAASRRRHRMRLPRPHTLAPLLDPALRLHAAVLLDALARRALRGHGEQLRRPLTQDAIGSATVNSVVLSLGTATAVMLLMAVVAWMLIRGRAPGRWVLDGVVTRAAGGARRVLGLALLVFYLRVPLPVYGTLWILLIAYFTRFMPYGLRFASAVLSRLGEEIEEAARTSGASWAQTFRRVTLPLLAPGLIAGWIYVVIASMRELSASILLTSPGTEVLPVRIFALYEGGDLASWRALGMVMTLVLGGAVGGGLAARGAVGAPER